MSLRPTAMLAWTMAREVILKFGRDKRVVSGDRLGLQPASICDPACAPYHSALGYTVLESAQAMEGVQSVIRQFLPWSEQVVAEHVSTIVADRGLLGIVGFISLNWFKSKEKRQ